MRGRSQQPAAAPGSCGPPLLTCCRPCPPGHCREYNIIESAENADQITAIVGQAWAGLRAEERAPFEDRAAEDRARFEKEQREFQETQARASPGSGEWLVEGCSTGSMPFQRPQLLPCSTADSSTSTAACFAISTASRCTACNGMMQEQFKQLRAMAEAQGFVLPQHGDGAAAMPPPPPHPPPQRQPATAPRPQPGWPQRPQQQHPQQVHLEQQQQQPPKQLAWSQWQQQQHAPPSRPPQHERLQQAAAAARQAAAAASKVAQLQRGLADAERTYQGHLREAEAAAARFPPPLGTALLARSKDAITRDFQQRRSQQQRQLQQAVDAVKAARQLQQEQEAEAAAAERQLRQGAGQGFSPPQKRQQPAAGSARQHAHGEAQQPQLQRPGSWLADGGKVPPPPKGVPETVG